MTNIAIRNYQPEDEASIENITYQTGFKGEGLDGRDYFDDKRLFYMIFIAYYARYEAEHFFVAIEPQDGRVVGFICGTPDTVTQTKRFYQTMSWRLVLRALLYTSWRYPKTFKTALDLVNMMTDTPPTSQLDAYIRQRYPAHLHINVLPEYHRTDLGTRLLEHFENHLIGLGVKGVHLETSSRNHKAVPFYHKHGYTIVKEVPITSHPVFDELSFLTFAKTLTN